MKKLLILSLVTLFGGSYTYADPGIMLDFEIIIHGPSGTDEPEMS